MSVKTFSDESLETLISLIKGSIATKENIITTTGILKKEDDGTVTSVDTITCVEYTPTEITTVWNT